MQFVAIDFETASQKRWSVVEVGLGVFEEGELVLEWSSLVNFGESVRDCEAEFMERHGACPELGTWRDGVRLHGRTQP